MSKKLFYIGDRVKILETGKPPRSAYGRTNGKLGYILGTYKSLCGGDDPKDRHEYSVDIDGEGKTSWFGPENLILVKRATARTRKKVQDMGWDK